MKKLLFLLTLSCITKMIHAQQGPVIYTIRADSVKITNDCDTAELIIENHTQNVSGFLFNKGRGRTEFRRPLTKLSDTLFFVGNDSLRLPNAWVQGGNAFNTTGVFGTRDNNHISFITNNTSRAFLTNAGNLLLGSVSDNGNLLQLGKTGMITLNPDLSRAGDRIRFGGYVNRNDGQNVIISASSNSGSSYRNVLIERDGNIGLGIANVPNTWVVGNPVVRVHSNGWLSFATNRIFFGNTEGPNNASALVTAVSNVNEFTLDSGYPNGQNGYLIGTVLSGALPGNVRAPLAISGRILSFNVGAIDSEAARFAQNGNMLIGTTTDNGSKLQVNGNLFANGVQHKIGKLAIVSGADVGASGFATGIRVDDASYGSITFQGTNQASAYNMFVFNDAFGGIGQDVTADGQSIVRIASGFRTNFTSGHHANVLAITPNYNLNLGVSNPMVIRGIYYSPSLTSIPSGSKHIAIETTTGDVVLGTTSGNTGIGTSAPTAQLHTTGTVRLAGLTSDNTMTRVVVSDANGNLYYRTLSTWAMSDVHQSDLAVNGTVSAQKLKITQPGSWPDYVFRKEYNLPTLPEVEQFIQQNSHLPGIPSAKEVEEKGIDVGANQAALLKKVEELTLYIIQQNKEISELKKQMQQLIKQ